MSEDGRPHRPTSETCDTPDPIPKDRRGGGETNPSGSRRDATISIATLVGGGCIVAFLTRYNLRGYSVWAGGAYRPFRSWEEYLLVNVTGLVLPPMLLVLSTFRMRPDELGIRAPERGAGTLALIGFAAMLPILLVVSRFPVFQQTYPLQSQAAYSSSYLLYFEITYGFYLFCWEWFYRGFLTFGLSRAFGAAPAIALQAVAFGIMHWGKPMPEFLSSFVGGAILGWLALRARSFLPGFYLHWAISATLDALAIHAKPGGLF